MGNGKTMRDDVGGISAGSSADAVVVLGCAIDGDVPSPALVARVQCGVALIMASAATRLVLSGGGRGRRAEAEIMRDIALGCGVPAEAILVEPRSRNTFENAQETARLLRAQGATSIVLVSDRYHLPRARLQFRRAGLTVVAARHPPSRGLKRELPLYLREIAAWLATAARWLRQRLER